MKNLVLIIIAISFLTITRSCTKDKGQNNKIGINTNDLWSCNKAQHFDSTKLALKLTGIWKWTSQSCFMVGSNIQANKDVRVTFTSSGSFSVTENSFIITQGTWKLIPIESGVFKFELNKPSDYLYGQILLCDEQVLFSNGYVDGCDNLFMRLN